MVSEHPHFSGTIPPPPPPDVAAKPKSRSLKIVLIVVAIVAIMIMAIVLFFVFVPAGAGKVSVKETSLSWEYSQIYEGYYVKSVTLKLTNNGRDQLFNLYVQVEGNWPVEYEYNKGFYTIVGAGLNAGETRTISSSSWNNLAMTKQTGTYTATFRVGKIAANSNILTGYQFAEVYGECTITTHVP